jgi:hypothetical protein
MAARTTEKKTTKRPSRPPRASTNGDTHVEMTSAHPAREEIAQRAFELFLARGGQHGHHEEDWLRAEREIRERRGLS